MIVLKQLAWELDVEPQRLRSILRKRIGIRKRWKWEENSQELAMVKENFSNWYAMTRAGSRANSTRRIVDTPPMNFIHSPHVSTSARASSKSPAYQ